MERHCPTHRTPLVDRDDSVYCEAGAHEPVVETHDGRRIRRHITWLVWNGERYVGRIEGRSWTSFAGDLETRPLRLAGRDAHGWTPEMYDRDRLDERLEGRSRHQKKEEAGA